MDDCEWIAGNALNEENLHFHINFLVKSLLRHLVQSQPALPPIVQLRSTSPTLSMLFKCTTLSFSSLVPSSWIHRLYISGCSCCLPHLVVQKSCYFSAMLRCIEYGWHIPSLSSLSILSLPRCGYHDSTRCVQLRFSTPSIPPP